MDIERNLYDKLLFEYKLGAKLFCISCSLAQMISDNEKLIFVMKVSNYEKFYVSFHNM